MRLKTAIPVLVIVLFALSSIAMNVSAETSTSGPVSVTGPSAVAINSTFNYTVNVKQIFTNYTVILLVSGYNLTGASPISPSYMTGELSGINNVTITAPSVPTTMFLFFQVIGNMTNHVKYYYNITSKVAVKQFTTLKVSISNPSQFSLSSVNVTFKVNGKYLGSKIVNLSKNSTSNVTYEWVSGLLPTGVYTVSVYVNNSLVKLSGGNGYTFQVQSGNPFVVYIYIGIIAFIAIIMLVLFIANYYARKRRPKWKK
ncbi:MAG: hypothetical protein ACP5UZ_00610 [Thermoplasmata archaeon]